MTTPQEPPTHRAPAPRQDSASRPLVSVNLGRLRVPVNRAAGVRVARGALVGFYFLSLYVMVGVAYAVSHDYFKDLLNMDKFWSAVFAVILWPWPALGIDIVLH